MLVDAIGTGKRFPWKCGAIFTTATAIFIESDVEVLYKSIRSSSSFGLFRDRAFSISLFRYFLRKGFLQCYAI